MASEDLYCDDVAFGQAAGEMVRIAEQVQAAARSLAGAIGGELGPPGLEQAAVAAAQTWAQGAGRVVQDATMIANNISAEIATYTNADQRAQAGLVDAIAGQDVDCTPVPPNTYATPEEREALDEERAMQP